MKDKAAIKPKFSVSTVTFPYAKVACKPTSPSKKANTKLIAKQNKNYDLIMAIESCTQAKNSSILLKDHAFQHSMTP